MQQQIAIWCSVHCAVSLSFLKEVSSHTNLIVTASTCRPLLLNRTVQHFVINQFKRMDKVAGPHIQK